MLVGLRWTGLLAAAGMGIVPPAAHAPQPVPQEPAVDGPDIVVIARKLRKVRIRYATNGRWVRTCDIDISSGDERIDRIMCAILRACVKSGHREVDEAKACIAGRIDSLDDAAEAAMLADPGARQPATPPPTPRAPDGPDIVVTGEQPDIVVTGNAPTMRGGLWRFRRSATLLLGGGGVGAQPMNFTQCLPSGAIEAMLRRAASETSPMPMGDHCNRMRLAFDNGRIDGRRSCSNSRPPASALATSSSSTSSLTLTGQYDERRIRLVYMVEMEQTGVDRGGGPGWNPARQAGARWQITATREGECPSRERRDQIDVNEAAQALFGVGGGTDLPLPFDD
ncbi:hypothetical protein [Sphingomonas sp. Leaf4]|nr:hypothetical protein [Sphingomonas sp. Leaf4]